MEEFHESSVVLPLGKYHSTSTIASCRLRLAAVRGAVYPQSCRRERFCCPPRRDRTKSPKVESGTEFSAAETGRRNGLIRLDCRNRDRANQSIWQTCL